MNALKGLNLALMFSLELAVHASVVFWAIREYEGILVRSSFALGGAIGMAVVWGLFAAPKAKFPVQGMTRLVFELAWFGVGVWALAVSGLTSWAIVLAVLYVGNGLLRVIWDQV